MTPRVLGALGLTCRACIVWAASLRNYLRVLFRFRALDLRWPTQFLYDDIAAIVLGREVSIGPFSEIVVLAKSGQSSVPGRLEVGDRVVIGAHANVRAAGGAVSIGPNTIIGQGVSLIAANHSIGTGRPYRDLPWDEERTGVRIGENVWIGAGAILLPGVSVGSNAIIAAGSVVTKDIPQSEIWAGVPAAKVRALPAAGGAA